MESLGSFRRQRRVPLPNSAAAPRHAEAEQRHAESFRGEDRVWWQPACSVRTTVLRAATGIAAKRSHPSQRLQSAPGDQREDNDLTAALPHEALRRFFLLPLRADLACSQVGTLAQAQRQ